MREQLIAVLFSILLMTGKAEAEFLVKARDCPKINVKTIDVIDLPKGYHEGLYGEGTSVWICNGEGGKVWIVDTVSRSIIRMIESAGDFTEALTKGPEGAYYTTEWNDKKIYSVKISGGKMIKLSGLSTAPAHPAGAVWASDRLYVITWTRGLGTKFDLLEFDADMKLLRKTRIKDIQEPDQMTWDGKYLWITSWFHRLVYKVDVSALTIVGRFISPIHNTTGIFWDGKYMWLTGTYSDLYKLEIGEVPRPAIGGARDDLSELNNNKSEASMKITVTSPAFKDGGMIPAKYTCDGEEVSPPILWSAIPEGAKSIALVSDDPDAPMGDWVHWVIFNIPPDESGLPEAVPAEARLANGAVQGTGTGGETGYAGPCPPSGTHRYYFRVYALDRMLDLRPGAKKANLLKEMEGHILAEGELMGRYKR